MGTERLGSVLLSILLLTSLLTPLLVLVSVATVRASIPAPSTVIANGADDENYYIIIQGQSDQYNTDISGDPPWKWYVAGDRPPIMAAKEIENGAVVLGTAPTCRGDGSMRWTPGEWDVLLDKAFQWMVPGADNVLWYEGYGVYNDTTQCSALITALTNKGYDIDGDSTEPIDSGLLAPYDILVIPQLQLGAPGTGGNPDLLPGGDVLAIKSWVEGGGGLLIMEGSDFWTYQFYKVQNKILKALDMGIYFQSDTIELNSNGYFTADVNDNLFGHDYQIAVGTTIEMYGACSLAELDYYVIVSISPLGRSGEAEENLTYTVTISNEGENDDNYTLEVTVDNEDWVVSIIPENVSAKTGEENTATLGIKIPDGAAPGDYTWATVTATSQGNENVSDNERAGAEVRIEPQVKNWTVASNLFPEPPVYGVTVGGAGENIYITNTSRVVRYNTTAGWWEEVAVPGMFMNGSCLCWDNGNYIYALGGGSYTMVADPLRRNYKFYRYDISNDNWTGLADTPWHQGPGDALTWVKMGDNEYIYAFLGTTSSSGSPGNVVQFWRYNIADDNWDKHLASNPYGADDGASLAWTGGDYIYAFPGAYDEGLPKEEERHFLRYSILGDNWVEMAKTPYNAEGGVDDGGSLAYPGSGDNIYALKGGSDPPGGSVPADNFWSYSISENNWEILEPIPAGVGDNNGRRLGVANGNIYCWRGSFGDGTLWVYSLSGRDVDVSISPDYKNGVPGATLEYSVTVKNTGAENDNYKLENTDTEGWILELSKNLLTNIAPGENENVTLTVTIPGDAEYCTEDLITVTATSQTNNTVKDSASCIAHQDYFEKECMPDLGQHSENWCWVAAAANSIYWYSQHGYPELIDNIDDPTPYDNRYITDPLVPDPDNPACPGHYVLFEVIASHCNRGYSMPVSDNDYLLGLRSFMAAQGALLEVHEIIDPTWIPSDPNTLPLPLGESGVEWRTPTFEDYRRELLRCQDVILWLDLDYEPFDHVVTGVAFYENQWILISDPWSTGAPDHNNDFENKQYDNCQIISEDPFRIFVPSWGQTALVPKMIYISPAPPWSGTAFFSLVNLYTVNVEKILDLNRGSKLVVKFYDYGDAYENENVIETFTTPPTWHVEENESARHPEGVGVKKVRLDLTTDDTEDVISTIASFTVRKVDLETRFMEIPMYWAAAPPEGKVELEIEFMEIPMYWAGAPS